MSMIVTNNQKSELEGLEDHPWVKAKIGDKLSLGLSRQFLLEYHSSTFTICFGDA